MTVTGVDFKLRFGLDPTCEKKLYLHLDEEEVEKLAMIFSA